MTELPKCRLCGACPLKDAGSLLKHPVAKDKICAIENNYFKRAEWLQLMQDPPQETLNKIKLMLNPNAVEEARPSDLIMDLEDYISEHKVAIENVALRDAEIERLSKMQDPPMQSFVERLMDSLPEYWLCLTVDADGFLQLEYEKRDGLKSVNSVIGYTLDELVAEVKALEKDNGQG